MKKIVAMLFTVFLLSSAVPVLAGSQPVSRELRSADGKLLYKTKTTGNRTEVMNPSGKLLWVLKELGDTTEVRLPNGKLLYKVKPSDGMVPLPGQNNVGK